MSVVFKGADFSAPISFIGMYSDGTPMVKSDQWREIQENADTLILQASSLQQFAVGMFLCDVLDRPLRLILPYLPGARQDRSNPTGDVLWTARSVAKMINDREFTQVISVDPHSDVMPKLINNFVEFPIEDVASKMWKGYDAILGPDKGAHDRASRFAHVLGKPLVMGSKIRDVSSGALSGFEVEVEAGKHYLVVDDICDGGGTFLGLGEKIREQGAYADLYVTHGIFSKGTDGLKKIYKNIYTTNSRNNDHIADVNVFDVVTEMENYR